MSAHRQHRQPYIFVIRLWFEPRAGAKAEMRGRVQDVGSGEVIYFRAWADLVTFFETTLVIARPPPALDDDNDGAPADG